MRVTADTNTIVSGSLWKGNPRRVLKAARDGLIELYTTRHLLAELEDVLGRSKFAGTLASANRSVADVVTNYAFVATVVKARPIEPVVLRDPDDDAVLACAIAARCEVVVSGDSDLLDLKQHEGLRIITATELLTELGL